jgi:hypothetical protein
LKRILYAVGLIVALYAEVAFGAAADTALERQLSTEVDRFVAADGLSPPELCQVLFVGSSSIVLWKDTLADDMAPLPVINRGFGGSHIEHVNRWFDQIVAPYWPRAIVFYAGENDLDAGKSVAGVVDDFDKFMAMKKKELGMTPVYFISLKPSKLRISELPQQTEVNDAVLARARKRSDLHYIDVVSSMLEAGQPRDIYLADNLHMGREGYLIWTKIVKAALLRNARSDARSCRLRASRRAGG